MHLNMNTVDTQYTACFGTQKVPKHVVYCVSVVLVLQCMYSCLGDLNCASCTVAQY